MDESNKQEALRILSYIYGELEFKKGQPTYSLDIDTLRRKVYDVQQLILREN